MQSAMKEMGFFSLEKDMVRAISIAGLFIAFKKLISKYALQMKNSELDLSGLRNGLQDVCAFCLIVEK